MNKPLWLVVCGLLVACRSGSKTQAAADAGSPAVTASAQAPARAAPIVSAPPAIVASREIGADEPQPKAVCAHMDAIRAAKTPGTAADPSCVSRMVTAALFDGKELWALRGRCILEAQTVDAFGLCNRAHHPTWPTSENLPSDKDGGRPTTPP